MYREVKFLCSFRSQNETETFFFLLCLFGTRGMDKGHLNCEDSVRSTVNASVTVGETTVSTLVCGQIVERWPPSRHIELTWSWEILTVSNSAGFFIIKKYFSLVINRFSSYSCLRLTYISKFTQGLSGTVFNEFVNRPILDVFIVRLSSIRKATNVSRRYFVI